MASTGGSALSSGGRLAIDVEDVSRQVSIQGVGFASGTYRLEGSSELHRWETEPNAYQTLRDQTISMAWELPQANWSANPEPAGGRFYRVRRVPVDRGRLIDATMVGRASREQLEAIVERFDVAGLSPAFDVALYRLTYETISSQGKPTVASGAVAIPEGEIETVPLPLLSYQHGTVVEREDVPSAFNVLSPESLVTIVSAANGYIAVATDYLGLGESPGFHPYLLVRPTVSAVIDMLRATRAFLAEHEWVENGQLFLLGYSQGGQATMAVQRELEGFMAEEFAVTASAPMAGPYDLSTTTLEYLLSPEPYSSPAFVAYLLVAYNEIYRIFPSLDEIFAEPYLSEAIPLLDGNHSLDQINRRLPSVPRRMLDAELTSALQEDPDHPLRIALEQNDLLDWVPISPTRLYHCAGDETVPPENTEVAVERFLENGATKVERIDPMPSGDHGECVLPAFVNVKEWFDSFVDDRP